MDTFREQCRQMSTETLKAMLRADAEGRVPLDVEIALTISAVLAEREHQSRSAQEAYRSFVENYMSEDE